MSDAVRTGTITGSGETDMEMAELPVFDEMLSPIKKPVRARIARPASRETGDAFDRAFAALEDALRERDESLAKPMPTMAPAAPLAFSVPFRAPEMPAMEMPFKTAAPAVMPTGSFSAPSASFVQPAFERVTVTPKAEAKPAPVTSTVEIPKVEANAPIIQPAAAQFERVDAILAQMQMAAQDVMQKMADAAPVVAPKVEAAKSETKWPEETIVFEPASTLAAQTIATTQAKPVPTTTAPVDEIDLMPFGMATLRMMVM